MNPIGAPTSTYDPLGPLVDEIERRISDVLRAKLEASLNPMLLKVSRVAELLSTHPDEVRRLVQRGELVGYPFPNPESQIHIPYKSIGELLDRREKRYHADHAGLTSVRRVA